MMIVSGYFCGSFSTNGGIFDEATVQFGVRAKLLLHNESRNQNFCHFFVIYRLNGHTEIRVGSSSRPIRRCSGRKYQKFQSATSRCKSFRGIRELLYHSISTYTFTKFDFIVGIYANKRLQRRSRARVCKQRGQCIACT